MAGYASFCKMPIHMKATLVTLEHNLMRSFIRRKQNVVAGKMILVLVFKQWVGMATVLFGSVIGRT